MADFYGKLRETASRLIKEKGQLMTLTKETQGAYDQSTNTAAVAESSVSVMGIDNGGKQVRGQNDERFAVTELLLSPVTTTGASYSPSIGDKITYGGASRSIQTVDFEAPGGTVLMWIVTVAGGQ